MSFDLRCHHCSHWVGESREPLEFAGCFAAPKDRQHITPPRDSWRCPSCRWVNVFRPFASVELKKSA